MNKILKPVTHGACLAALLFVADAQAIIGVAPGGSVARRHAIVATEVVVASSSANASAASCPEHIQSGRAPFSKVLGAVRAA